MFNQIVLINGINPQSKLWTHISAASYGECKLPSHPQAVFNALVQAFQSE